MALSLGTIGAAVGGYFGGPTGAAIGKSAGDWLGDNSGDIISSGASIYNANQTRDFNAEQANLSRESQLELANTQYQRTVKDLNAAGLSPMLAYSRGASPMPAAVTASSGAQADAPRFGETAQRNAAADLARSQYQVNVQTARKASEEADLAALRAKQEPARFYMEQAEAGSRINQSTAQAGQTDALERLTREGKAPAPDTNIVRNIKDAINYGGKGVSDAKSALDNFISRTYKSIRGIK
jgi:hypothetical protein